MQITPMINRMPCPINLCSPVNKKVKSKPKNRVCLKENGNPLSSNHSSIAGKNHNSAKSSLVSSHKSSTTTAQAHRAAQTNEKIFFICYNNLDRLNLTT